MSLLPVFLKLQGRVVLVVGGGEIAEAKVESLLMAHASVCLVSPRINARIAEWTHEGQVQWRQRAFEPHDIEGAALVIAATDRPEVNHLVFRESQRRNVLCNVVDDPPHCDFYFPAVVRRGDLQIAISTNGQSPAFAQQLRQQLELQFTDDHAQKLAEIGEQRRAILTAQPPSEERKAILHQLARQAMEFTQKGGQR